MVRAANTAGSLSFLFGEDSFADVSFELFTAFQHASLILAWQENLESHEVPPEWMWPFGDELAEWFEEVRLVREAKFGGSSDGRDEVPMVENELSSRFK